MCVEALIVFACSGAVNQSGDSLVLEIESFLYDQEILDEPTSPRLDHEVLFPFLPLPCISRMSPSLTITQELLAAVLTFISACVV